jgi:hypothetical protein
MVGLDGHRRRPFLSFFGVQKLHTGIRKCFVWDIWIVRLSLAEMVEQDSSRVVMSGNEAFARGAFEAGIRFISWHSIHRDYHGDYERSRKKRNLH